MRVMRKFTMEMCVVERGVDGFGRFGPEASGVGHCRPLPGPTNSDNNGKGPP